MIQNIFFDFDGVIIDSMPIRDYGFRKIFEGFDPEDVEELVRFHRKNGGLSRFVKIRYFFTDILSEPVTEAMVKSYADHFASIMKERLFDKKYLIPQTIEFLSKYHSDYNLHIVSGSEHKELNQLCEFLGISSYFITIAGAPTPKTDLIKNIMDSFGYNTEETILIGDAINDYQAATENGLSFYGFNNPELAERSHYYIESFNAFASKLKAEGV